MRKYYVYVWATSDGRPFYVGKGCGNRLNNLRGRNVCFNRVYNNNPGCYVLKIADNLFEDHAYKIEKDTIDRLSGLGHILTNIAEGHCVIPVRHNADGPLVPGTKIVAVMALAIWAWVAILLL